MYMYGGLELHLFNGSVFMTVHQVNYRMKTSKHTKRLSSTGHYHTEAKASMTFFYV